MVQVSLGPHVKGAALMHVDPSDSKTVLDGAKKRIAVTMPKMKTEYRVRFRKFVQKWLDKNLVPLEKEYDYSVEHWLENTNYPMHRKLVLLQKNKRIWNPNNKKYDRVSSFIKDETYTDWKHARTINSRSDEFKTIVGPYVKAIEKRMFKTKWFIKYIRKPDRAQAICDRIQNKYKFIYSTDFSSFEAHFVELLEDTEFLLYRHMLKNSPKYKWIMARLEQALLGTNICVFKWLTLAIFRRRMSGEMSTSMGNGFANLMLILFILELQYENNGCTKPKCDPFVEGDDGIFGADVPMPDKKWLYDNLGLDLKIETCTSVSDASFCGNVFDEYDKLTITDPIKAILGFGWTTQRYEKASNKKLKSLLRAKAFSMLYEYPGMPILQEMAKYALRVTEGSNVKFDIQNEY